jgi:hypothetical protein
MMNPSACAVCGVIPGAKSKTVKAVRRILALRMVFD